MPSSTGSRRIYESPAFILFSLMMALHTWADGVADLERAGLLHSLAVLAGGATIATGWFRGNRRWMLAYVPMVVGLALAGVPEARTGPGHVKFDLMALYSAPILIGLVRLIPRALRLQTAQA